MVRHRFTVVAALAVACSAVFALAAAPFRLAAAWAVREVERALDVAFPAEAPLFRLEGAVVPPPVFGRAEARAFVDRRTARAQLGTAAHLQGQRPWPTC